MKILEIVHLRLAGDSPQTLAGIIRNAISSGPDPEVVTLYHRKGLETDLAIHIRHLEMFGSERPSVLGLRLASALGDFGLVEHTVWVEHTETINE